MKNSLKLNLLQITIIPYFLINNTTLYSRNIKKIFIYRKKSNSLRIYIIIISNSDHFQNVFSKGMMLR